MRARVAASLLACALVTAACGSSRPERGAAGDATSTTTASVGPDSTTLHDGWDGQPLRLALSVERSGPLVRVTGRLTDEGDDEVQLAELLARVESGSASDAMNGIGLIDTERDELYRPGTSGGSCDCSSGLDGTFLQPGRSVALTAVYRTPPPPHGRFDVFVPNFGTVLDVPVVQRSFSDAHGPTSVNGVRLTLSSGRLADAPERLVDAPISTFTATRRTIRLGSDVLFAFDRASLSRTAHRLIVAVVSRVRRAHPRRLRIDGYTDSIGSRGYNLGLSRRRAAAVAAAVRRALGHRAPSIIATGHGEADPVAPNRLPDGLDNPAGRARNRRVTLTFVR